MKTIVTGGSGYLGTHVRRFFGADDFSRRSDLDVLNQFDARKVADYDVVIHLAAMLDKDPSAADMCFQTNVQGTINLLQNMEPGSVFIYASTKDIYGNNGSEFAEVPETCLTDFTGQSALEWSKLIAERYVEYYAAQRRVRACIFRMSVVYARPSSGNENGFVTHYVESIKHGQPIRLPTANPIRDLLYVDDFSRACQSFIDSARQFGLYNLGGGKRNAASLRGLIGNIGKMIELEPKIVADSNMPLPVPLNYISNLTRIRNEIGWKPEVSIDDGIRNLL